MAPEVWKKLMILIAPWRVLSIILNNRTMENRKRKSCNLLNFQKCKVALHVLKFKRRNSFFHIDWELFGKQSEFCLFSWKMGEPNTKIINEKDFIINAPVNDYWIIFQAIKLNKNYNIMYLRNLSSICCLAISVLSYRVEQLYTLNNSIKRREFKFDCRKCVEIFKRSLGVLQFHASIKCLNQL